MGSINKFNYKLRTMTKLQFLDLSLIGIIAYLTVQVVESSNLLSRPKCLKETILSLNPYDDEEEHSVLILSSKSMAQVEISQVSRFSLAFLQLDGFDGEKNLLALGQILKKFRQSSRFVQELKILVYPQNITETLQLLAAIADNKFNHSKSVFYIILSNNALFQELKKYLHSYYFANSLYNQSSYFILAENNGKGSTCLIYELDSFLNHSSSFVNFSSLDDNDSIQPVEEHFRNQLAGKLVKVTAYSKFYDMLNDPLISAMMTNRQKYALLQSTLVCVPVLQLLQEIYDFRVEIIPASDFIRLPPNDTTPWNGIAKLLLDGTADVSIDRSVHVAYRAKYFTLLYPIYLDRVNIYFRQPPSSSVQNIFVQPFSSKLWRCLTGHFIGYLIIFSILQYIAGKTICKGIRTCKYDKEIMQGNLLLMMTSFAAIQGWYQQPRKIWLRVIFFTCSIMGLVLFTAYSAKLVSLFTYRVKPIKNLDEFAQSPIPLHASESSPFLGVIFNESVDSRKLKPLQLINFEKGLNVTLENSNDFTPALLSFTYAFYSDGKALVPHANDQFFCDKISEIPALNVQFRAGMIVGKNSSLKEPFNYGIVKLYEYGILHRIQLHYFNSYKPRCGSNSPRKFVEVSTSTQMKMSDTLPAFFLIAFGTIGAIMILGVEKLIHHRGKALSE